MDIIEAGAAYVAAWGEENEEARRRILEECWADDGVYLDPTARAEGREALVQHIGGFHTRLPGYVIETTSGIDAHDGYFRFAWRMLGPDGAELLQGVDFGRHDEDGRMTLICGFFGPWPERA